MRRVLFRALEWIPHRILGVGSCVVFHEAKPARRLPDFVKTHDNTLHIASSTEQFVNLFLACIER